MRTPSVRYHSHEKLQLSHFDLQSGFTLIEIMIVMTIIGILAAIGVVSYQTQIRQTQLMAIYQEINHFRLPYQTLLAGVVAFSIDGLNMPTSTKYCQFTVKAPNLEGDTADAVVCNIQNLPYLQKQSLSLTFTENGNWECKASSGILVSYLPQACRP